MHTIRDIRKTLESYSSFNTIKDLRLNKDVLDDEVRDLLLFDLCEHTPFYSAIYDSISKILEVFRDMPFERRKNCRGLTVKHLGFILSGMGEPWPDLIIATAIQYQLLKI